MVADHGAYTSQTQYSMAMLKKASDWFLDENVQKMLHQRIQSPKYDDQKADVYALGKVLLLCCNLEMMKSDIVYQLQYARKRNYSDELLDIISKMLRQESNRPDPKSLETMLER